MFKFLTKNKKQQDNKPLTEDEVREQILYPFQKTDHWLHEGWEADVENEKNKVWDDRNPKFVHDDNYGQRHDAYDAESSLISYLYKQGFEVVKR